MTIQQNPSHPNLIEKEARQICKDEADAIANNLQIGILNDNQPLKAPSHGVPIDRT